MAELNMNQYLDLFLQEGNEQLEILEQELVKLEHEPSVELLQVIFRAAHTLKGSSRAMGFSSFAGVTHEMENLLDQLRSDQLPVTSAVIDVLFHCLDTLTTIKNQIAAGESDAFEAGSLIAELQRISSGAQAQSKPADSAQAALSQAGAPSADSGLSGEAISALTTASAEKPVFRVDVELSADCVMKWVRAFMTINAANELGELLLTLPDTQTLEDEQFDLAFSLFIQSDRPIEEIHGRICEIAEVIRTEVSPWSSDESPAFPNPEAQENLSPKVQAATSPAKAPSSPRKADSGQTVRVDVSRLDDLMNLVGELVIDRTRVAQIGAELTAKYENDVSIETLGEIVAHISRITGDLQDQIMKARMLPIETVFNRFPRMMRDLAQKVEKDIKLEMFGGETELDRSVIEVIGDPLIHILRNSADHGIELPSERIRAGKPPEGVVTISARHQENHFVIEIVDDGKGIDVNRIRRKAVESGLMSQDAVDRLSEKEALQLIFQSGLSTATEVTDVSGRGVGMDIVRSNIQKLGGIIDLESTVGVGTRFSLRLPLTLAIIRGLLVQVGTVVYVLPLGSVIETLLFEPAQIQRVHKEEFIVLRGVTTPLVRLRNLFVERGQVPDVEGNGYVVIVGLAHQRIGFVVDRLIGEQEVVIKSLSRFVGDLHGISGATILGDGNVAMIVDVNGLVTQEAA
jgi:two-component system chemotaxis sensor kinase CheA